MGGQAYRVGLLPVPGFALMSYACVAEPLRAANLLSGRRLYEVVHFAPDARAQSSGAAAVEGARPLSGVPEVDLLIVVAGGDPFSAGDEALLGWLRRAARAGVRIGGVSGGPVILARAGLMEGRRMTVHWEHAALLAERHPDLVIERRRYVIDRDRVTCGGGIAPLDVMHALIAGAHGSAFAHLVSDWFLHTEVRAAGAPQRGAVETRIGVQRGPVVEAVTAMESHVGDPLSLGQLALIAGVTPRHLNRLFADAFGVSAMRYYRRLRLEVGARLLREAAMDVGAVAEATGFAGAAHFSTAYRARFGAAPSRHRAGGRAGSAHRG